MKPTANIIHKCEILNNLSLVVRNQLMVSALTTSAQHCTGASREHKTKKMHMGLRLEKKDKAVDLTLSFFFPMSHFLISKFTTKLQ